MTNECTICRKIFQHRKDLLRHWRTFHANDDAEKNAYECEQCQRSFKWKHILKQHQLTHSKRAKTSPGEDFECAECGKSFPTRILIRKHLSTHRPKENLAPAELKKLRNKQRKARRKAELAEKERVAQAQQQEREGHKREGGHHKGGRAADAEPDAPQQDELVPDKLAKVEDPLDQAIRFLQPLQTLCSDQLETHLMAFEIYSRKDRPMLMLQSVRRAHRLSPGHPEVHAIVVRLGLAARDWLATDRLAPPARQVLQKVLKPITGDQSPADINQRFMEKHINDLPALFQGARMMYLLDPSSQAAAIKMATNLDPSLSNVSLSIATDVWNALRRGDFGECSDAVSEYTARCHIRFPLALAFAPPSALPPSPAPAPQGVLESQENCLSN